MKAIRWVDGLAALAGLAIAGIVLGAFWGRFAHPFDLEWMEGGMLAHAWRLQRGLPIYPDAGPEWVPYIYPPGYSALLAALSNVFTLDYPLGRTLSIIGTLSTAGALVRIVSLARHADTTGETSPQDLLLGIAMAGCLLGTYRGSGGFFDLVRPDGMAMGLAAWSLALGMDRRRGAAIASGLLLATAFTVKHNMALFGVPLVLGIFARSGWREAAAFTAASAGPALAFTGWIQLRSDGHFLRYLLEVPGSHPMVAGRGFPGAIGEMGLWLPIASLVAGLGVIATVPVQEHKLHPLLAWPLPLAMGAVAAWWASQHGDVAGVGRPGPAAEAAVFFALGAGIGAIVVYGLLELIRGSAPLIERIKEQGPLLVSVLAFISSVTFAGVRFLKWGGVTPIDAGTALLIGAACSVALLALAGLTRALWNGTLSWRWFMSVGIVAVGLTLSMLMRGHHGGFLNVLLPAHFVITAACGLVLVWAWEMHPAMGVVGSLTAASQLAVIGGTLEVESIIPDATDAEYGFSIVETIATECEGPVFSPYGSWYPVQAGLPPGPHLIALWDLAHKEGPYVDNMASFNKASATKHWDCVVEGGQRPLPYGIPKNYKLGTMLRSPPKVLIPKTGWRVKPTKLLKPKAPTKRRSP